ncbi:MAG: M48 family metallopeptidase [Actinomycetota bacterium]
MMRGLVLILVLSGVAAALAAVASRVPAEVRNAEPDQHATDPSLAATFTDAQVERHGAYRRGAYAAYGAALFLEVAVLLILARGPLRSVLARAAELPGGWVSKAVLAALTVALVTWLAQLPLAYVRGYVVQQAWGLSTQTAAGWFGDSIRSLLVALVISLVGGLTFFALVRWQPTAWWLWGWAGFTVLTALLFFLYPVLIAPLFNRFTPLADQELAKDIRTLASAADVQVDEVLVADASRRSTVENAYVAGLGATKQIVLYDTLLEAGSAAETRYVVAHELGHEVEGHVLKNLLLSSLGLFVGFALLRVLVTRTDLLAWAGAGDLSDPRGLPLLILFATLAGLVLMPAQNAVSRSFETRADEIALELTDDPETAIRVHRRLAFSNLADLDPPRLAVFLLYSHPPVRDRVEAAVAEKRSSP